MISVGLQHLRLEENPILKMTHLEAASILLVGPTLKRFNDRGNGSLVVFWTWHIDFIFTIVSSYFLVL